MIMLATIYFIVITETHNSLKIRGVDTSNHNNLFTQEYYWNPNINWDKFTNFREYYWLPSGPDAILYTDLLEKYKALTES